MGVAGSGKSTVGAELASRHKTEFLDADSLHDQGAVERMSRGQPLTGAQRDAWMTRVVTELRTRPSVVVACSALKHEHRDRLRAAGAGPVIWIEVPTDEVARRLVQRRGHFATAALLASQLDDLEVPTQDEGVVPVDGDRPLKEILEEIEGVLDGLV